MNFQRLDQFIAERMTTTRTPGFAAAFFDGKEVIRIATYGFADLELRKPVESATLFEIGSITKTFTAIGVMQAVEKGLLELEQPVTMYLPWFEVQTKYEPITLHHLLTHTAGLIGVIDKSPDIRSAVWALRDTEIGWSPGSRFAYSDSGYQILTLILEAVYEKTFADIIQTAIFEPLGMSSSEPVLTHHIRPRLAKGYQPLYDDRPYHESHPLVPTTWIETSSGECSIASTAGDMAKFGQMLLNRGAGPNGKIISLKNYEALIHPHISAGWCEYGYGIMTQKRDGFTHIGHAGGMPGYMAEIIVDVENGIGMALLSTKPPLSGLFWQMMSYWRAQYLGQSIEGVELINPEPFVIENAADYAGVYESEKGMLTVVAKDKQVLLYYDNSQIPLESREQDCFYVNHPDFDRFLLQFGRSESNGEEQSKVTEVMYGADWYVNKAYIGQKDFEYPAKWDSFVGHYRSHNPWQTNFRVIVRKGKLLLVWPDGIEDPLLPRMENEFYVGEEGMPERVEFSQIMNNQALRALYSGCEYYRFFAP